MNKKNKFKKYYLGIIIIGILFTLNSCGLDEGFEKKDEADRDDINLIHKIGKQSLDKATKSFIDSITKAS